MGSSQRRWTDTPGGARARVAGRNRPPPDRAGCGPACVRMRYVTGGGGLKRRHDRAGSQLVVTKSLSALAVPIQGTIDWGEGGGGAAWLSLGPSRAERAL